MSGNLKQLLETPIQDIVENNLELARERFSHTIKNKIPIDGKFPMDNHKHWLKIPDVICVFTDMIGSTQLTASTSENTTTKAYFLFTQTITQIFHHYGASYIDIQGDGVFGLFNKGEEYKAFVCAITIKTAIQENILPKIEDITSKKVGLHIGIDQKSVLVKNLGFRKVNDREDRKDAVWAGKPINMAAKLSSMSKAKELLVSDRYFKRIQNELVTLSCGCNNGNPSDEKATLWEEIDVSDEEKFDFDVAWKLSSIWCELHGLEYLSQIKELDND